jgi:hypothetical protein
VRVAFVQMPCRSGWPSGVRGAIQLFAANDTALLIAAKTVIEERNREVTSNLLVTWRAFFVGPGT